MKIYILLIIMLFHLNVLHAKTIVGSPPDQADIRIGCLFPMTGRGGLYGYDSIIGIQMALDSLSDQPYKVSVIIEDTKSKPSRSAEIARSFIYQDNVGFLCGVVSSAVALAFSEVSKEERIPFIGTDHASSRLVEEVLHPYYFRVTNDTLESMAGGALYLQKLQNETHWKKIAFIGPDYDYGHRAWEDLRYSMEAIGLKYEISGEFWPKLYEPDYSEYIKELMATNPDVVIDAHWGGDLVAFIRQATTFGLFSRAVFGNFDTGGNYEVMATLKDEMPLGIILSARHHNNWPKTRTNSEFVSSFKRKAGRFPSYSAHGAYAGIKAIVNSYILSKQTSINFIEAMEHLKIKLPKDPVNYISEMDPKSHQIIQSHSIGRVILDNSFPPATRMLGMWETYSNEKLHKIISAVRERRQESRKNNIRSSK